MGGYGGYVWAAFGFTIVLMIGLLWQSWRLQQRRTDELAELRRTLRGNSLRGDGIGGDGRHGDTERPARRLVARKPRAEPAATGQGADSFSTAPAAVNRSSGT